MAKTNSPWAQHDLWTAHMALSDVDGQKFRSEERLNRAGPGLAGVDAASGRSVERQQLAGADCAISEEELRGAADKDFDFSAEARAGKAACGRRGRTE